MVERLTTLDASFLYLEEPDTPMHVGGMLILERPSGGVDALAALITARLPLVPRYRQRVAEVPGHLANPVWVDDPDFDIAYHVRRSGLPRPGTEEQLLDLVSRLSSRPLDRTRPLWEAYLVEGLAGDRVAVVTKTHPALVDGLSALDLGQVLLNGDPDSPTPPADEWRPRRLPSGAELVWEALDEYARRPSAVVDTARAAVTDVRSSAARLTGVVGGLLRTAQKTLMPAPQSPLNASLGRQRRVAVARAELDDLRKIREGARGDGQRRPAGGGHRRAPAVAARPWGARGGRYVRASPCAGVRAQRGRHRGEPGVLVSGGPARRRAQSLGPADPAHLRHAGDRTARPGGRRGQPHRADGVRATHLARAGRPGRAGPVPAAVQPGGHQRAGTPAPAVRGGQPDARGVPGRAAGPWAGPLHRDDQLRRSGLLRAQCRSGRRRRRRRARRSDRAGGR